MIGSGFVPPGGRGSSAVLTALLRLLPAYRSVLQRRLDACGGPARAEKIGTQRGQKKRATCRNGRRLGSLGQWTLEELRRRGPQRAHRQAAQQGCRSISSGLEQPRQDRVPHSPTRLLLLRTIGSSPSPRRRQSESELLTPSPTPGNPAPLESNTHLSAITADVWRTSPERRRQWLSIHTSAY